MPKRAYGQHQQMISMGGYTAFDPDQPWDMVWTEAVKADKFWQKEFLTQCIRINCNATSMSMVVSGDAPISHSLHDNMSAGVPSAVSSLPRVQKRAPAPAAFSGGAAKKSKTWTQPPPRNAQGLYTANREGKGLCQAFQTGACSTGAGPCPANAAMVHQCAKCLSSHGANACVPPVKGKGKAGGKGGKGGKGDKGGKGKY